MVLGGSNGHLAILESHLALGRVFRPGGTHTSPAAIGRSWSRLRALFSRIPEFQPAVGGPDQPVAEVSVLTYRPPAGGLSSSGDLAEPLHQLSGAQFRILTECLLEVPQGDRLTGVLV